MQNEDKKLSHQKKDIAASHGKVITPLYAFFAFDKLFY